MVGLLQGGIVLAVAPLILDAPLGRYLLAAAALAAVAVMSALLGLLVAARLRSVENFAGIINVVLFPLLFLSGALYPTAGLPPMLRALARINPVSYAVDLVRASLGQPAETPPGVAAMVVAGTAAAAFGLTALLFDPEQRFVPGRAASGLTASRPGRPAGPG
jgi:ABC-2 type transport system permease protein